jgi:hypothetical protein
MIEVKAPASYDRYRRSIFLAGSIEMGKADNWQARVIKSLQGQEILVLNPRRDDWDSSWNQSIADPQFREQVEWELRAMEDATHILMYFDPSTKSPISLLELGLHAKSGKLIVCCPDGFWRKGNVEIVCKRYGVTMVDNFDNLTF